MIALKRSRSGTDIDSPDSDNYDNDDNDYLFNKLSRQSEESTSPESTPDDIPLLTQNKSRGEEHSYTLPALDLAQINTTKRNHHDHFPTQPIFNTLELSEAIIDDVYDSLCSWDETEIAAKDKHTMDIQQFVEFFDKYIYSTMCLIDDEDMEQLEKYKEFIAQAMFEYISFTNSDEIQFKHFVSSVSKLKRKEFIKALNVYDARSKASNANSSQNSPNTHSAHSPLESIYEHTPLTMGNDKAVVRFNDLQCNDQNEAYNNDLQSLLMKDAKLLFQRYDSNKDGTLSMHELKSLLTHLYPTLNDEEFRRTFLEIDQSGKLEVHYIENIDNLVNELENGFTSIFPKKHEFLQLLIKVFGDRTYATILSECKSYDDMNRDTDDRIELVENIHNQFMKKVKQSGHCIEITKTCVEDLWRWIEENGIPAIRTNEIGQNQHINSDLVDKYNNLCDEYQINKAQLNKIQQENQTLKLENQSLKNQRKLPVNNQNDGEYTNVIPMVVVDELKKMIHKLQDENTKWREIVNETSLKQQQEIQTLNQMTTEIKSNMLMLRKSNNRMQLQENQLQRQNDMKYSNMEIFVLFLLAISLGYFIGIKCRKYKKLLWWISYTGTGITIVSVVRYKRYCRYNWKKMFSVTTGFLFGFCVALKMKK